MSKVICGNSLSISIWIIIIFIIWIVTSPSFLGVVHLICYLYCLLLRRFERLKGEREARATGNELEARRTTGERKKRGTFSHCHCPLRALVPQKKRDVRERGSYLYQLLLLSMSAHECLLLVSSHSALLKLSAREVFYYSTVRLFSSLYRVRYTVPSFHTKASTKNRWWVIHIWKAALKLFAANPTAVDLVCHQLFLTPSNAFQFCVFSHRICIYIKTHFLPRPTSPEGRIDIVQSETMP